MRKKEIPLKTSPDNFSITVDALQEVGKYLDDLPVITHTIGLKRYEISRVNNPELLEKLEITKENYRTRLKVSCETFPAKHYREIVSTCHLYFIGIDHYIWQVVCSIAVLARVDGATYDDYLVKAGIAYIEGVFNAMDISALFLVIPNKIILPHLDEYDHTIENQFTGYVKTLSIGEDIDYASLDNVELYRKEANDMKESIHEKEVEEYFDDSSMVMSVVRIKESPRDQFVTLD